MIFTIAPLSTRKRSALVLPQTFRHLLSALARAGRADGGVVGKSLYGLRLYAGDRIEASLVMALSSPRVEGYLYCESDAPLQAGAGPLSEDWYQRKIRGFMAAMLQPHLQDHPVIRPSWDRRESDTAWLSEFMGQTVVRTKEGFYLKPRLQHPELREIEASSPHVYPISHSSIFAFFGEVDAYLHDLGKESRIGREIQHAHELANQGEEIEDDAFEFVRRHQAPPPPRVIPRWRNLPEPLIQNPYEEVSLVLLRREGDMSYRTALSAHLGRVASRLDGVTAGEWFAHDFCGLRVPLPEVSLQLFRLNPRWWLRSFSDLLERVKNKSPKPSWGQYVDDLLVEKILPAIRSGDSTEIHQEMLAMRRDAHLIDRLLRTPEPYRHHIAMAAHHLIGAADTGLEARAGSAMRSLLVVETHDIDLRTELLRGWCAG